MSNMGACVGIRVDVTSRIGAGHAMRCLSVACALKQRGAEVVFFVSCEESASFLEGKGFECVVLGGDERDLTENDAALLGAALRERGARRLLVDSYGVDGGFFTALGRGVLGEIAIAYIDDMYSNKLGILDKPLCRPADVVVNCNVFAGEDLYRVAYHDSAAKLLLGPRYAPLREEFAGHKALAPACDVTDVLVTTGSTNPSGALERFSSICLEATKDARVHVVVGPKAEFCDPESGRIVVHKGDPIVDVMGRCQMAVAAAGVTLLELAAMGIPTLAVGIVDNQQQDIQAFEERGLGVGCFAEDEDSAISAKIKGLLEDPVMRDGFSHRCVELVDGAGADRIAVAIMVADKGAL